MLGLLGYDFLWADAEHSSASPDHIANMMLAAERRGLPTIVRIGYGYQNIIGHVQKYLVAGAQGILLPQCESRKDVERIVEAVNSPPSVKGDWQGSDGTLGDLQLLLRVIPLPQIICLYLNVSNRPIKIALLAF